MIERAPVEVTNLDGYGFPALPWSRLRDLLAATPPTPGFPFFLGTVRPDGHLSSARIGAVWINGDLSFMSGLGSLGTWRRTRPARSPSGCQPWIS
jgi:hypothetical protein